MIDISFVSRMCVFVVNYTAVSGVASLCKSSITRILLRVIMSSRGGKMTD